MTTPAIETKEITRKWGQQEGGVGAHAALAENGDGHVGRAGQHGQAERLQVIRP